jgi:hypothetical protein
VAFDCTSQDTEAHSEVGCGGRQRRLPETAAIVPEMSIVLYVYSKALRISRCFSLLCPFLEATKVLCSHQARSQRGSRSR